MILNTRIYIIARIQIDIHQIFFSFFLGLIELVGDLLDAVREIGEPLIPGEGVIVFDF